MKRILTALLVVCWSGVGWGANTPMWLVAQLVVSDTPTATFTPTVTNTPTATHTAGWPEATPTPRPVLGSLVGITRETIEIDINDYVTVVSMRAIGALSGATGTVEVPMGRIDGLLLVGIARPDPDLAPDDAYDIEIIQESTGHDVLGGAGMNRSNAGASAFVPLPVAGSSQAASAIGPCYLRGTNLGAGNGFILDLQILGRASGPPESSP